MIRSQWMIVLCLVVLLGMAGCSNGGGSGLPNPGNTTIDDPNQFEADFNRLMQSVVVPVIQAIGNFDPFNPVVRASLAADSLLGVPCNDIADTVGCVAGTAVACPTGDGEVTITFAGCETIQGILINGTVVSTESDTSATADWNVTIGTPQLGDILLIGNVDLTESASAIDVVFDVRANFDLGTATLNGSVTSADVGGGCVRQTTNNVELYAPGLIILVDGPLTFCDASDWPDGTRELIVIDSESDFRYEMNYDSSVPEIVTDVLDNSSDKLLATCVTDLSVRPAPSTCEVF